MDWFATHRELFAELSEDEQQDIGAFDGNAQGFRILMQIENHLFKGGMRVTYATVGTFLKYPNVSAPSVKKFGVCLSAKRILD